MQGEGAVPVRPVHALPSRHQKSVKSMKSVFIPPLPRTVAVAEGQESGTTFSNLVKVAEKQWLLQQHDYKVFMDMKVLLE